FLYICIFLLSFVIETNDVCHADANRQIDSRANKPHHHDGATEVSLTFPHTLSIGTNDQYRKTDLSKRLSFLQPAWLSLSYIARRKALLLRLVI
ncbi:hypothetical protein ACMWHX_24250, partial [Klebsiella pneumoniae]